jgi:dUTP pyrophosphatase
LETIKIKYIDSPHLEQTARGNWIDLYLAEDTTFKAGEFKLCPLGVAMKLPHGYEALTAPRSSTFKRYGLIQTNSIGVIDSSYCGDTDQWMWPAIATRDITIPKGTRLCQFRIIKSQPVIEFEEVNKLNSISRGGFGTSGV